MLKAIFFDLDGTLLPLDEDEFIKAYFGLLCKKFVPLGYDKDELIAGIWQGTKLMMTNDGKKTNEQVFWDYFYKNSVKIKKPIIRFSTSFTITNFCKQKPFVSQTKTQEKLWTT